MNKAALVLAPFSQDALGSLERTIPVAYESWKDTRKLYSPEELSQRINMEDIAMLVVEADFVFEEVFQQSRPLKFLGVCRNSLDHIDVKAATEYGVTVVNTPGRNAQAVAELTIGLMLSLARGIPRLNSYVKGGRWDSPVEPYVSMGGAELGGKTLGILGLGSIGLTVARLGMAFGMSVLAYDPFVSLKGEAHAETLGRPDFERSERESAGVLMGTLEEVVSQSDFLSIHTPGTCDTEGLLDSTLLSQMKSGSYIINTAAYSVIEEAALVAHLKSGHLAGAALDVHRTHPIHPSSPLLELENVILTPHIGGATDGTVKRQSWMMVEEIHRFLKGQRPINIVNHEVWRHRE